MTLHMANNMLFNCVIRVYIYFFCLWDITPVFVLFHAIGFHSLPHCFRSAAKFSSFIWNGGRQFGKVKISYWTHNDMVKSSTSLLYAFIVSAWIQLMEMIVSFVAKLHTSNWRNREGSLHFYLQLLMPWPLSLYTYVHHFSITFLITL